MSDHYCNVCGEDDATPDEGHYMLADPPKLCVGCRMAIALAPEPLLGETLLARRAEAEPRLRARERDLRARRYDGNLIEQAERWCEHDKVVGQLQAMNRLRVNPKARSGKRP